ncbi:putative cell surface glycoprotein [Trichinella spiralis]|uniref:putative cell surface glycoprotein n=1 Tax=Trichinella spiralis TaxID=6334 RepID=UPI0001EFC4E0|nr:putative cell surface glycoprotein [Trichinella spiralis]
MHLLNQHCDATFGMYSSTTQRPDCRNPSDNAETSKAKKVHNSNNDEETATENSVKVADRKRLTYADMAKLGVAERAAGSSSDAATVVNDAAPVNDAADNASAVPGEDKPRPAGSRPTSTASSRVSSRDFVGCFAFTTTATQQQQAQGLEQIQEEDDKGKKGQASILFCHCY